MRWLTSAESAGGGNNEKGELMTNQEIMSIAMRQSAIDLNADISDFTKEENIRAWKSAILLLCMV